MRSKILVDSGMKRVFTLPGLGKSLAKYANTPTTDSMPTMKSPRKIRRAHFQNPDFFFGDEESEDFFMASIGRFMVPRGPRESVDVPCRCVMRAHQRPTDESASREGNESGFSRRRRHASFTSRRMDFKCSIVRRKTAYSWLNVLQHFAIYASIVARKEGGFKEEFYEPDSFSSSSRSVSVIPS